MSHNTFWYAGLSVVFLIVLAFVFYKQRNMHTLFQFLVLVEIAYLIEAVIYIFMGSYLYHPKIIKYNSYYDSHMGALTSNLIAVPVVATIISIFQLNWVWIIVATVLLAGIEWLFVKLQIYTLHWWRIEYTFIGLLMYFPFSKIIYRRILNALDGFLHSVFLFLCIAPIAGTLHFLPIMFFSNRIYRPGWYENQSYDTSAFSVVYYIGICIILVVLVKMFRIKKWLKIVLTVAVALTVTYSLKKVGILFSVVWWDSWYYILSPLVLLFIAEAFSERLYRGRFTNK
ncbi:hypothetical protein ASG89_17680 [Paenibacillus sp. Soil766]|uniref:hypothetical protein n=1 Tax=Paenibacillus sp. Soil766 TaxID=1736404 RepID=UPI00070FE291|nr:hypothetical protein [Paenibacillus sp. Soil766]KRF07176.1 hypothetical protein ASG89_17680 [Paenibacillus sp. Soil766]